MGHPAPRDPQKRAYEPLPTERDGAPRPPRRPEPDALTGDKHLTPGGARALVAAAALQGRDLSPREKRMVAEALYVVDRRRHTKLPAEDEFGRVVCSALLYVAWVVVAVASVLQVPVDPMTLALVGLSGGLLRSSARTVGTLMWLGVKFLGHALADIGAELTKVLGAPAAWLSRRDDPTAGMRAHLTAKRDPALWRERLLDEAYDKLVLAQARALDQDVTLTLDLEAYEQVVAAVLELRGPPKNAVLWVDRLPPGVGSVAVDGVPVKAQRPESTAVLSPGTTRYRCTVCGATLDIDGPARGGEVTCPSCAHTGRAPRAPLCVACDGLGWVNAGRGGQGNREKCEACQGGGHTPKGAAYATFLREVKHRDPGKRLKE